MANLLVSGPQEGVSLEEHRRLLRDARDEREAAELLLARASFAFRRQRDAAQAGYPEIAAALPADAALVAYVRYLHHRPRGRTVTAPAYLAWVVRPGGSGPLAVPLGPAAEIEDAIQKWRSAIPEPRAALPAMRSAAERRYREVAAQLRRAVWDPVSRECAGARRVFVVADAALHLLSLDTLADEDGRYLVESAPVFHYLSTERDLLPLSDALPPGRGLLVVGGADFDRTAEVQRGPRRDEPSPNGGLDMAPCTDLAQHRFHALPGSESEADSVAQLWAAHGTGAVLRLSGPEATEHAVKLAAPGRSILHLATHGFVIEDPCSTAAVHVAPFERDLAPASPGEAFPPLSGLALAGSNLGEEDGILTATEVAAMDLTGVDWVVLSGCETGLGTLRAGEGVLGLRRSFQIAGAQRLVMSLWAIEDASTLAWIRRLYEARASDSTAADAVRQASLDVIRARRDGGQSTHPFYWGAFVAVGRP
jgi:CHAT domain-containing protein